MQSVSSRIWTRVAVSISYDDNDYTTPLNYETRWIHFFLKGFELGSPCPFLIVIPITPRTHTHMQSSSNEITTPVSDSAKCQQTKSDTYALIPELTLSRRLGLVVKLGRFRSQLGASHWRVVIQGNSLSVDDNIYIYIIRYQ